MISLAIFYFAQSLKYLENFPRKRDHDLEDIAGPDPARPTATQERTRETQNGQTVNSLSRNEVLRSLLSQDVDVETARSLIDVLDSRIRPRYLPISGQSLQLPDSNERPRSDNIPQSSGIPQGNHILQSNNVLQSNDISPEFGAPRTA